MRDLKERGDKAYDCVVIGGGPAGMAAAIAAASSGMRTALLEKNRRSGAKLLLTGGGRCNLTSTVDTNGFVEAFGPGGDFLRAALSAFSPQDLCDFMRDNGVALVTEGSKLFARDGSQAVLDALERAMKKCGVELICSKQVAALMKSDDGWTAVTYRGNFTATRKMILALGGLTYIATGSSGDGYPWIKRLGHTLITPRPAAGPLILAGNPFGVLTGVSMERVKLGLLVDGKKFGSFEGPLLFTRGGISGPVVLDATLAMVRASSINGSIASEIVLDFAPGVSEDDLTNTFCEMRERTPGKTFGNACSLPVFPNRLYRALLNRGACDVGAKLADVSKKNIRMMVDALKRTRLSLKGFVGANEGMVTVGGVSTREIDPRTMGSLVAPGIFFAGEFIDIAAPSGGFNLQAAFSTGFLAGRLSLHPRGK